MARSTLLLAIAAVVLLGGALVLTQRSEPVVSVTDNDGTRVEAPGTKVESDGEGTRIQAPGVDITVPKGKDSE